MGFSGGGSNITKPHTHDSTIVQDGGSLAANVTQFGLTAGSILYSDGSNIQELGVGSSGDALKVNGAATAPEWGSSAGAWNVEGYDTEAVLTTQLQVSGLSDQDFYQVFYNISTDASATNPTHFGLQLNADSAANYNSVKVQAVNNASPTTAETNGGTYWKISANLHNLANITCMGVITIYKSQTGQLAAGAMYRDESGNMGYSSALAEYITYSQGVNPSITGAITSIELMVENASIKGSMQVNSMSWT